MARATVSSLPLGFVNRKLATAEDPAVAIKDEIETTVELASVDTGSVDGITHTALLQGVERGL